MKDRIIPKLINIAIVGITLLAFETLLFSPQMMAQQTFPRPGLGRPAEWSYRWCPNNEGEIILYYAFGYGLNQNTPNQLNLRVAIDNAIDDWNLTLLDLFGGQFNIVPRGPVVDPLDACPTPDNTIIFRMGWLNLGDPCTAEFPPKEQLTACGIERINESGTTVRGMTIPFSSDYIPGSTKKKFKSVIIDLNPKEFFGQCGLGIDAFFQTAKHEIGHALGLGHIPDCAKTNFNGLMCSPSNTSIISNDEKAILGHIYGIHVSPNPESIDNPWIDLLTKIVKIFKIGKPLHTFNCGIVPPSNTFSQDDSSASSRLSFITNREYKLFINENDGPFEQLATLDEADWVDNSYEHSFARGYQSARIGMRVIENNEIVNESISDITIDIPAAKFSVLPENDVHLKEIVGNSSDTACVSFSMSDNGDTALSWQITSSTPWLNLFQTEGELPPGQSFEIQMCTNSLATQLPIGEYIDTVIFHDLSDHIDVMRRVILNVTRCLAIIEVSTDSIILALKPNQAVDKTVTVGNIGDSSCSDLTYKVLSTVLNASFSHIDSVGASTKVNYGDNRYRGDIYLVSKSTVITKIESYLNFAGPRELEFIILEGDNSTGPYHIVHTQKVIRDGVGAGFYPSDSVSQWIRAGNYYIIAVGWTGGNITFYWDDTKSLPLPVGFGQHINGFTINTYPVDSIVYYSLIASAYFQRISTEDRWLRVSPTSGIISPGQSNDLVVFADATGLVDGRYFGRISITSNDPTIPLVQIPVRLKVSMDYLTILQNIGWNMISIPLEIPDSRKAILFPAATSPAFTFEATYIEKESLSIGIGYWLKFASPQSTTLMGNPFDIDTINVSEGWNMIGSISEPLAISSINSDPVNIIMSDFFRYSGNYEPTDTLNPGEGYWVKANQPGRLILSSTPLRSEANKIRIVPTDELPPLPPNGGVVQSRILPREFALRQTYPNPFNPIATVEFDLPVDARVTLIIYDLMGREVQKLKDNVQFEAGIHQVSFDASDFASGVYCYRLDASSAIDPSKSFAQVKKMLLLK